VGTAVSLSGSNTIGAFYSVNVSGSNVEKMIGVAEETASVGEVIRVRLRGY
jgi:hypothetical protein